MLRRSLAVVFVMAAPALLLAQANDEACTNAMLNWDNLGVGRRTTPTATNE